MNTSTPARRNASLPAAVLSTLFVPAAPAAAARLAYQICHPPRPKRYRDPAEFGLTGTDLRIPVAGHDGTLSASVYAADPERVVVMGHGIGSDRTRSLAHAKLLNSAGYTVVLYDFRNHGRSFDDRGLTGFSRRFADDLIAVVEHVRRIPDHEASRIALFGFSMSCYAVMYALSRLDGVGAVVCDSGPTADPGLTMRNLLRAGGLPLPAPLLSPPASVVFEAVCGRLVALASSVPGNWPPDPGASRYASTPMLFLVGDRDDVVAVDEVRSFGERYPRANVIVVPGAGHLRPLQEDRERYATVVLDFLSGALGDPAAET